MYYLLRIVFVVALCMLSHISSAQNTNYKIELLSEDEGFVSSEIYSILQDHHGFLWFGTAENGLMKYDGKKITVFENDSGNSTSLSHNNAGNIILEQSGAIWVGTWGGGANRYDPKTNIFQHFKNDPSNNTSLSSNRVQSMHQDVQGTLWFGTYADGLNRLSKDGGVFERFQPDESIKTSVSNNRIWVIRDAGPNSLWVGTSNGLNFYDKESEEFKTYKPAPNQQGGSGKNQIRHIMKSKQGELYVGTEEGVFLFDQRVTTFREITGKDQSSVGKIYSLIEDRYGIIWAANDAGLFQLMPEQKKFTRVDMPNEGAIRIIFQDKQGIIWATSENYGIYKITQNRNFFELNINELQSPNGLIRDVNGDLIIATATGHLFKVEKGTEKIVELSADIYSSLPVESIARKNAKKMQSYKPVLHQSNDSTLWFAQQSSLLKYDIEIGVATEIKYSGIKEVRAINSTIDGRVWVGTYKNGLYVYDASKGEFEHLMPELDNPFSLSHAEVLIMYRDKQHRLWIGTGEGLNLWDDVKKQFLTYTERADDETSILGSIIQSIYQTSDGVIWVGTKKGFNRLDEKTNQFQRFTIRDDSGGGQIKSITDDDVGNLWLSTSKGITKVNPITMKIDNYNQEDGLLGVKYYTDALAKMDDGTIYLSGPRGIDYFNPLEVKHLMNNGKVVLTGFQKMGMPTSLDIPFSYAKDIVLSYSENFFSLEFASLDLYAPEKHKYAYMLEGFDKRWVYIGNNNTASYTNLDGGTYNFRVKSSSGNSEWSSGDIVIRIIITPPLWKTWWAYCLYILTVMFCCFLFVKYRTHSQNLEVQKQRMFVETLEQQVSHKTASLIEKTKALEASNLELEQLTYIDALSGLFNRRYFDRHLLQEITRHKRKKEALALIICDVDCFKLFNDQYGHIFGDHCIQKVSECMKSIVKRSSDSVCRYGGEEFALILPNTSVEEAVQVVDKIMKGLAALEIEHVSSPLNDFVTMSYGIYSTIPSVNTSPQHMIKSADSALYASKDSGRNCFTVAGSISDFPKLIEIHG
jgi:diguanylate cyclase (GGDEF)-like protein